MTGLDLLQYGGLPCIATFLEFKLRGDSLMITRRIQLFNQRWQILCCFLNNHGRRRIGSHLVCVSADIVDAIDSSASTFGPLAVAPVRNEQAAVVTDHQISWFESVRVVGGTSGEVDFLHRLETAAAGRLRITHDRAAPFAEEQTLAKRFRKCRFQIARATG